MLLGGLMSSRLPLHLNTSHDDSDSDDTDTSSISSFPPLSPSIASSHTSNWERSDSPVPSILSMTSSLREAAFRQEYGRYLNNYSEVYRLPADEEELERLGQSLAIITVLVSDLIIR